MEILDVLPEGLDILVDGVRGHTPNLDEPVVLDEDCVASQIAVNYWFLKSNVRTSHVNLRGY